MINKKALKTTALNTLIIFGTIMAIAVIGSLICFLPALLFGNPLAIPIVCGIVFVILFAYIFVSEYKTNNKPNESATFKS